MNGERLIPAPEAEDFFRAACRDYWELVGTAQEKKVQEFGRGMVWGMLKMIEAAGHKDAAEQVLQETAKEIEAELRAAGKLVVFGGTAIAERTRKLLKQLR